MRLPTTLQNEQNVTHLLSCIQTTTPASSCCRSYGHITTISELPAGVVDRLRHYFLTYKDLPGRGERKISIPVTYEAAEAYAVIRDGMGDYTDKFRLHTDFGTQHGI